MVATELLDALTTVDLTERDDERDGWDVPDELLLQPANELLARGLAWALRLPPPDDHRCESPPSSPGCAGGGRSLVAVAEGEI